MSQSLSWNTAARLPTSALTPLDGGTYEGSALPRRPPAKTCRRARPTPAPMDAGVVRTFNVVETCIAPLEPSSVKRASHTLALIGDLGTHRRWGRRVAGWRMRRHPRPGLAALRTRRQVRRDSSAPFFFVVVGDLDKLERVAIRILEVHPPPAGEHAFVDTVHVAVELDALRF